MRNRISAFGGAVLCLGFLPYGPFVCAGRYVDVYTHTHTYTHIHLYVYICIYVYTHKYIHIYIGLCVCQRVALLCLGLLPFGPVGRGGGLGSRPKKMYGESLGDRRRVGRAYTYD